MLTIVQGIITSSARQHRFPTPLCTTAEQIYLSALLQGYGPKDDSAMVRQYFTTPIASVTVSAEDQSAALQLVLDLMQGVNLVAAAEAVAFARYLKVDLAQFYDLVSAAAGASKVFITKGLEMIKGQIGEEAPAGSQTVDEAIAKLEAVVQQARDLHCPLHLGNAALNVLFTARRHGLGAEGATSVIKLFGKD